MAHRLILVTLLSALVVAGLASAADTIHFRAGGGSGYTDVTFDDTYVRTAYSTTTYGGSGTIEGNTPNDRVTLIAIKGMFTELPLTSGGADIQINSATLHMTRYNQGTSGTTISIYPVTSNWLVDSAGANENDVSWEHLEQSQSTDWASGNISTSDYDTSVCETGSWVSNYNQACAIDVTDVVAEIYSDQVNYGLALTASAMITMRSSEHATSSYRPSLEITYEYVGGATYTLTVNSGTGDGDYAEAATPTITADAAPSGQEFDEWVGDTSGIASVTSSSTTLTMPAANQEVTATYTDKTWTLTVNSGTGGGSYVVSAVADIDADAAPSGQEFDEWVGDTEGIADVSTADTTLTMPYSNAEITATYTDAATGKLSVSSVSASGYESPNEPANTLDEDLGTRWSESGYTGVWIKYDLGSAKTVSKVYIAWYVGDTRSAYFDIEGSTNDSDYSMLYDDGESSGTTTALEEYDFTDTTARYIRINGYGNENSHWNSLTEVEIHAPGGATYTLTVNSGTGDGDYAEDALADIDADAAPSGQDFDEWIGDTSGIASVTTADTTLTMPAANQEITATYTDKTWTLTVNSGTGDGSYVVGAIQGITADAAPSGQDFDEWTGDVTGIADVDDPTTTITMPYANAEVTATYTDKTWTLTVNSGSGDGSYVVGAIQGITADAAPSGQDFDEWTGDVTGIADVDDPTTTITMPYADAEITATYTDKTWTLTVNSGTGGGNYVVGAVADIDADAPASGKQFDEWVGDTAGIGSVATADTTLTMPYANAEITATYEDIPSGYTLTVNSGTGDGSYSESQVANITADAAGSGKFFDAWIGDTANIADINDPTTTLTMPAANQEITATYTEVVSGLVSRFTFDIDASDSYGTNDGTLTNGASVTTDGTRGGVLSLDGDNDYVSLPSTSMAAGRSELTLSMWVNPDTWASGDTIWEEYDETSYWQFTLFNGTFCTRDSSTGTTGSRNNDISLSSLSTSTWQHIALVYSTSNDLKAIYIDGVLDASSSTSVDTLTSTRDGVGIGLAADGNHFDGKVDDVRLYNRALNTTEIAYLAEQTLYTLTVNSGSGDGEYIEDQVVNISADAAPSGQSFDDWIGDTSGIANVNSASTTLTMPASATEITASYTTATTYTLTVNSGSGDGNYVESYVANISADSPASGKQFDDWVGDTSGIANVNSSSTTLTMPAANTEITATYEDIPAGSGPSISSVSDSTPTHEQSITLSGSSFGSQGGSLLAWDDFEDQEDGSIINGADIKAGSCSTWSTQYNYSGLGLKFDDAHVHAGSLAAKVDWSVDTYTIRAFGIGFSATDQIYLSYWRYMEGDYTTSDPTCNHKQFYLFGNSSGFPQGMPMIPAGTTNWGFYINNSTPQPDWNGTNNINTQGWTYANTDDTYQRWEFWCKLNDPYTASNGVLTYWKDGVIGRHRTDYRHRFVDGEYDEWRLGHMAQQFTDTAKAWFDDVYAATTQARVELGNNSTFTSCTHREIQIPTSWGSSSITIDFNKGSFSTGTAYLFVVDEDGNASSGYAVTVQ